MLALRNPARVRGVEAYRNPAIGLSPSLSEWRRKAKINPLGTLYALHLPSEIWWEIAAEYPIEASEAPTARWILNDDEGMERWQKLEAHSAAVWTQKYMKELIHFRLCHFLLDFTEKALPAFEAVYTGSGWQLKTCWQAASSFVMGSNTNESQFHDYQHRAGQIAEFASVRASTGNNSAERAAGYSAKAVYEMMRCIDEPESKEYSVAAADRSATFVALAAYYTAKDQTFVANHQPGAVYKDPDKAGEKAYQAEYVRGWRLMQEEIRAQYRHTKMDELEERILQKVAEEARIKATKERARQREVEKRMKEAVEQARDSAEEISRIMIDKTDAHWPRWLGLGLIAGGTIAAFVLGPETLVISELGAEMAAGPAIEIGGQMVSRAVLETAASNVAAQITTAALQTGIETATLEAATWAEIDAAILAEDAAAELTTRAWIKDVFVNELRRKLQASGVELVETVAEVVTR